MRYVSGLSGGKDSVAMTSWAKRTGLDPVPVYNDTKWEWDGLAAYLDQLEAFLGPIVRLDSEGFEERTRRTGTFPSRVRKWCSPELKIEPFKAWLDRFRDETGDDVTVIVGYRREESKAREGLADREWSEQYDCEVWRPILDWTLADVISEHHRAGIPLNPLYLKGAERVGCWPCIHAPKSEIRLVADIDPARIDRIEAIEREIGQTMFALEESRAGKEEGAARKVIPTPIREVVAWSRTSRGGVQLAIIPAASGCARWGICEAPIKGGAA